MPRRLRASIQTGRAATTRLAAGAACAAVLAGGAVVTAGTSASATDSVSGSASPASRVVAIVGVTDGTAARPALEASSATVLRSLPALRELVVRVPGDRLAALRALPGVRFATPDRSVQLTSIDPALGYDATGDAGSPWALGQETGAAALWQRGITGRGVDVAVLDTGVAPVAGLTGSDKLVDGPDLSFSAQASGTRSVDTFGHGTFMAGLIAGRDGAAGGTFGPSRYTGMAPDARIVNVRVGGANGAVDVSQVLAGIDWVVTHRHDPGMNMRVLNLSFGTDSAQSYLLDPLAYATEVAWRAGIVVTASVGNGGAGVTRVADPAIDPFVLAVGAADSNGTVGTGDDTPAAFTTIGSAARHADLLAPGAHLISLRAPGSSIDLTYPGARVGTRFFRGSGTSQATAVVSGAAALLLSQRPALTPDQVKYLLVRTATQNVTSGLLAGVGEVAVDRAAAAATPSTVQSFSRSTGTGTLEGARGSLHLVGPDGVTVLSGERDAHGAAWRAQSWALAAGAGTAWSGGTWNSTMWAGSSWTSATVAGVPVPAWGFGTWSPVSWDGTTSWSGLSWRGLSWRGLSWRGLGWSAASWS